MRAGVAVGSSRADGHRWREGEGGRGQHLRILADAKRERDEEATRTLTADKGPPIAAKGPAPF